MKIVLDTSVLIAAFYQPLAGPSFSKEVYDYIAEFEQGVVSPFILDESRAKCVKKLKWPLAQTAALEALLRKKLIVHAMNEKESFSKKIELRDPNDRPILDLALAVRATHLLTWDKDLLVLKSAGHCTITTPRVFWDTLA